MVVISVEFTIFIFVSLSGVGLDFFRPLDEFFVLNLCKHLGNGALRGGKTRSGRQGSVKERLSLILYLESRSDLLFFISSL